MQMLTGFFLRISGPVIFAGLVYFYLDLDDIQIFLKNLQWSFFVLSIAVVPFLIFIRTLRWAVILSRFDIHRPFWRYFSMYFVEMAAVMVVASLGTFIKVFYFIKENGYLNPVLSIIADKYFDYLLPVLFGTLGLILALMGMDSGKAVMILFAATGACYVPARKLFLLFKCFFLSGPFKKITRVKGLGAGQGADGIYQALDKRNYALSFLGFVLYFLCVYFLSKSVNFNFNFPQIVLILSITALFSLVPASFLGLGPQDIGLLFVFQLLGHRPEDAVLFSVSLFCLRLVILLMGIFFWVLTPPPLYGKSIFNHREKLF